MKKKNLEMSTHSWRRITCFKLRYEDFMPYCGQISYCCFVEEIRKSCVFLCLFVTINI